jgi:pentatricopeptide repeat protein
VNEYPENTQNLVYYPTQKIRIPVNKENALKSGLVKEKDSSLMVDHIDIDLPGAITKKSMMMLDIIANNDWKRPIYFSGGSFDDAEFIWMKDYLQLDGLAYKLVPIKTERSNSFDMGRIDTDDMYDIVTQWDWGNSGSPDLYHDPQTRVQGISYRSNLARLMSQLIEENKIDKAKDIINLAMAKMPVEQFGYYHFVLPFIDGYYKVGETNKAHELFNTMKKLYQERLEYYDAVPLDQQYDKIDDIITDMESYRRVIDVLIENDDREMAEKETLIFNEYIDKFNHFYKDEIMEDEPVIGSNPDMSDSVEMDSTTTRDSVLTPTGN